MARQLLLNGTVAAYHLITLSLHATVSQILLGPIYGAFIASEHRLAVRAVTCLLATAINFALPSSFSPPPLHYGLILVGTTAARWLIVQLSETLGTISGPAILDFVTIMPVAYICVFQAAKHLRTFMLWPMAPIACGIIFYLSMMMLELRIAAYLVALPGFVSVAQSWIPLVLSTLLLMKYAPKPSLIVVPLLYTTILSGVLPRSTTPIAWYQSRLDQDGWQVLESAYSTTGYVSVLQNDNIGYRLLRCDHSLLGGEWLLNERARKDGATGTEPVYAVFNMLEAVRLVETQRSVDVNENVLVIGLGVGTAPKAFLAHGIQTTIIELDPRVHEFAGKYFDLPTNHTAHIDDAVAWVQQPRSVKYHYIIHDVFTGGAEPLLLFTTSFITRLKALLHNEGVIAINYAGDLSLAPTKQVLNTINTVFAGRCRVFRDLDIQNDPGASFNMVIYCLHPRSTQSEKRPHFRPAVEMDYLGSLSRREYLVPRPQNELQFPTREEMAVEHHQFIDDDNVEAFGAAQRASAREHWRIMRTIIPSTVWELF